MKVQVNDSWLSVVVRRFSCPIVECIKPNLTLTLGYNSSVHIQTTEFLQTAESTPMLTAVCVCARSMRLSPVRSTKRANT